MKIKNKKYRQFLETGEIEPLEVKDLEKVLNNVNGINGKYVNEARALIIMMYWTGARPVEILNLQGKHIEVEKSYLKIQMRPSKRGLSRPIYLRLRFPYVRELYKHCRNVFDEMFLFYNFRSRYKRPGMKKGKTVLRPEVSSKLGYFFKKWFIIDGISYPPYFLRHNRFSKMILKGASVEDIRSMKGAKTMNSVFPYIHLSAKEGKKRTKFID